MDQSDKDWILERFQAHETRSSEQMATLAAKVDDLYRGVERLNTAIYVGNGTDPIVIRVDRLEKATSGRARILAAVLPAMLALLGGVATALITVLLK